MSGFTAAPKLTQRQLSKMLVNMQAGIMAVGIELAEPLAEDWQDRSWNELENVRKVIEHLQQLVRHSDSAGFR